LLALRARIYILRLPCFPRHRSLLSTKSKPCATLASISIRGFADSCPDLITIEQARRIVAATRVLSYRVFFFTLFVA